MRVRVEESLQPATRTMFWLLYIIPVIGHCEWDKGLPRMPRFWLSPARLFSSCYFTMIFLPEESNVPCTRTFFPSNFATSV